MLLSVEELITNSEKCSSSAGRFSASEINCGHCIVVEMIIKPISDMIEVGITLLPILTENSDVGHVDCASESCYGTIVRI